MISIKQVPEISKAEYDILNVLWKKGKQSVREVHDQISQSTRWAYTTTKTTMDRMAKKELLKREAFHGIYLYKPLITRPRGMARFIQFFADRILEMDRGIVLNMLSKNDTLTRDELNELKALLDSEEEASHD